MARLIDGDALKENVIQGHSDTLSALHATWAKALAHAMTFAFLANINNAPTVDAVPVVRCRDCKWWRGPIYGNRCSYHSGPNHTEFYDADEFCSRGERKGGDE